MKVTLYCCVGAFGQYALLLDPQANRLPADLVAGDGELRELVVTSDDDLQELTRVSPDDVWHDLLADGWHLFRHAPDEELRRFAVEEYRRNGLI